MTAGADHDRRITPARPTIAAAHLRDRVVAERYEEGSRRTLAAPATPLRAEPRSDFGIDTELLRGEVFTVYDEDAEGWCWGQAEADGYVGWLPAHALMPGDPEPVTHAVSALRTFVYPGPSIKLPVAAALPFGARAAVLSTEGAFSRVAEGYLWSGHLRPVEARETDFVEVAKRFGGAPYLWGGKTSLGLDCSALVQTALGACGIKAPRDSDLQERELGQPIDPRQEALQRGDLLFWKGHVGILRNRTTLLHANGFTMTVASEPLADVRTRIHAATGADVTSVRRLSPVQ